MKDRINVFILKEGAPVFYYFDYAATTPVCKQAVQAAQLAMESQWENPSSLYPGGQQCATLLSAWRDEIAQALGCRGDHVFFTSCASESNNWAIYTALEKNRRKGKHIITTAIEHPSVQNCCKFLAQKGYDVTFLKPNESGIVTAQMVCDALREDTALVSVMMVNNELGSIFPVSEIAQRVRTQDKNVLIHCDAVQGFLHMPFSMQTLHVDFLSLSGHKIGAPKGIGALYVRDKKTLVPLLHGGGQEMGMRAGTEATAQIAAFAAAVAAGRATMQEDMAHIKMIHAYARQSLQRKCRDIVFLLPEEGTSPHILAFSVTGYKSEVLVRVLGDKGIYLSSGSACHKGKASHVYAALNLPKKVLDGVLRASFSAQTTVKEVDALVQEIAMAQDTLYQSLS